LMCFLASLLPTPRLPLCRNSQSVSVSPGCIPRSDCRTQASRVGAASSGRSTRRPPRRGCPPAGRCSPGARVADSGVVLAGRQRERVLDGHPEVSQAAETPDILDAELRAHRDHAAADINANARGHDGAKRRNDRSDGGAEPEVGVRHQRQVRVDKRHAGCPLGLLSSPRLQDGRPVHQALRQLLHVLYPAGRAAACLPVYWSRDSFRN
jgi:hypothetical protein